MVVANIKKIINILSNREDHMFFNGTVFMGYSDKYEKAYDEMLKILKNKEK